MLTPWPLAPKLLEEEPIIDCPLKLVGGPGFIPKPVLSSFDFGVMIPLPKGFFGMRLNLVPTTGDAYISLEVWSM